MIACAEEQQRLETGGQEWKKLQGQIDDLEQQGRGAGSQLGAGARASEQAEASEAAARAKAEARTEIAKDVLSEEKYKQKLIDRMGYSPEGINPGSAGSTVTELDKEPTSELHDLAYEKELRTGEKVEISRDKTKAVALHEADHMMQMDQAKTQARGGPLKDLFDAQGKLTTKGEFSGAWYYEREALVKELDRNLELRQKYIEQAAAVAKENPAKQMELLKKAKDADEMARLAKNQLAQPEKHFKFEGAKGIGPGQENPTKWIESPNDTTIGRKRPFQMDPISVEDAGHVDLNDVTQK